MPREGPQNPEVQRHAAEKLDEANKARFLSEKGIIPSGRADRKRARDIQNRRVNKPGF